MGKTKGFDLSDWRWRPQNSRHCRDCNRSVGNPQWLTHLSSREHKDNAKSRESLTQTQTMAPPKVAVTAPEPTFLLSGPASISEQFKTFKSQVIMRAEDCVRMESEILRDLKPLLLRTLGICRVSTFGSMKTGLALIGSDFDFNVSSGYASEQLNADVTSIGDIRRKVYLCANALIADGNFTNVTAIYDAKVPIVNALHIPTRTKCDISFSGCLGNEHGRLLRFYFNLHPRFLEVMQVIKFWAKKHNICNGRDYISSYGWNLLFVGYLQSRNWAPSVCQMQPEPCWRKQEVLGCRVDFEPPSLAVHVNQSHLEILSGFFQFYNNFSFEANIMCPYLGMKVSRSGYEAVTWSTGDARMQQHIVRLQGKISKGTRCKFLRIIQDPFNHDGFVVCPTVGLPFVKSCISRATSLCEEALRLQKIRPTHLSRFLETLFAQ